MLGMVRFMLAEPLGVREEMFQDGQLSFAGADLHLRLDGAVLGHGHHALAHATPLLTVHSVTIGASATVLVSIARTADTACMAITDVKPSALRHIDGDPDWYELWPTFADVPAGWRVVFGGADRGKCLEYVEKNWTDMRPKSLREAMASDPA